MRWPLSLSRNWPDRAPNPPRFDVCSRLWESMGMMRLAPSTLLLILTGLLFALAAGGCMIVRQEFAGHDPGNVWSTMRAVAEAPEYDDWHIITNEVWESPDEARMEVYRELHRTVRTPPHKPRTERRNWRFRIEMLETDPPSARLISRGFAVPAHARVEGNRFFGVVLDMLGDPPARVPDEEPIAEERPVGSEEPDVQPEPERDEHDAPPGAATAKP